MKPAGSTSQDSGAGAPQEPAEDASAAEVNSRINRILRIVKSPTAPAGGDDRHGAGKGRDRKGGGKNNGGGQRSGGQESRGGGQSGGQAAEGARQRGRRGGQNSGESGKDRGYVETKDETWQAAEKVLQEARQGRGKNKGSGKGKGPFFADDEDARRTEAVEAGRPKLNADAAIFVPNVAEAAKVEYMDMMALATGYYDEEGKWVDTLTKTAEGEFPEIIMNPIAADMVGEREFIGLQLIAEMGEWVVLRKEEKGCLPFFWSRETGFKTWKEPPAIKEAGIGHLLLKWSAELPESGIEPGPEAWPEPLNGQRRDRQQRRDAPGPAASLMGDAEVHSAPARAAPAPPGFAPPGFAPPGFGPSSASAEKGAGRRRAPGKGSEESGASSGRPLHGRDDRQIGAEAHGGRGQGPASIAARALQDAAAEIGRGSRGGRGHQADVWDAWDEPSGGWDERGAGWSEAMDTGWQESSASQRREKKPKEKSGGAKWLPKASAAGDSTVVEDGRLASAAYASTGDVGRLDEEGYPALSGKGARGSSGRGAPELSWQPKVQSLAEPEENQVGSTRHDS